MVPGGQANVAADKRRAKPVRLIRNSLRREQLLLNERTFELRDKSICKGGRSMGAQPLAEWLAKVTEGLQLPVAGRAQIPLEERRLAIRQ